MNRDPSRLAGAPGQVSDAWQSEAQGSMEVPGTVEPKADRDRAGRGNKDLWKGQLDRLAVDAPAAVAASLRIRARRVADEESMRRELGELGYTDETIERAARRARGSIRRPRFTRTLELAKNAIALALAMGLSFVDPNLPLRRSGKTYTFTAAARKAMEGRFERYVRGSQDRGLLRVNACAIFGAIAEHADPDGWAHPAIGTIAREANTSERSVERAVPILEELGYLMVFPQEMEREGPRSHKYLVLPGGLDVDAGAGNTSPAISGQASLTFQGAPGNSAPAPAAALSPPRPKPAHGTDAAPSGREAVTAALRAYPRLARLDNPADVDALASYARRNGKEALVTKAFRELDGELAKGTYANVDRPLAIAFLRDVLAPGESDEERERAELADLPAPRVCRAILGQAIDRAEAAAAKNDLVPPAGVPGVTMTLEQSRSLLEALEGRAAAVDAGEQRPP
jgi:hypothetical protein